MTVACTRKSITIIRDGVPTTTTIDHSIATVPQFAADPAWTTHRPRLAEHVGEDEPPLFPEPLPKGPAWLELW